MLPACSWLTAQLTNLSDAAIRRRVAGADIRTHDATLPFATAEEREEPLSVDSFSGAVCALQSLQQQRAMAQCH